MNKQVILIDTENMGICSYAGLENLNGNFEVVFFESIHSISIPKTNLMMLDDKGIDYSFEWCERNRLSKDSMDFCIIAYLALRSRLSGVNETYYVLSRDSDFEVPSAYIADKIGIEVRLAKTIDQILETNNLDRRRITPDHLIRLCVQQSTSKQQLHCLMQKTLKGFYSNLEISQLYRDNVHLLCS